MHQKLTSAARIVLGLMFFVFGLNGFLQFIPVPAEGMTEAMMGLMNGLAGTGYFFPLLKGTEVLVGLMLLANFWVPLALVILSPIVVNIFAVHFFLDEIKNIPIALLCVILMAYLGYSYRSYFSSLFVSAPQANKDLNCHHHHAATKAH